MVILLRLCQNWNFRLHCLILRQLDRYMVHFRICYQFLIQLAGLASLILGCVLAPFILLGHWFESRVLLLKSSLDLAWALRFLLLQLVRRRGQDRQRLLQYQLLIMSQPLILLSTQRSEEVMAPRQYENRVGCLAWILAHSIVLVRLLLFNVLLLNRVPQMLHYYSVCSLIAITFVFFFLNFASTSCAACLDHLCHGSVFGS